jgi:hypothetical protein
MPLLERASHTFVPIVETMFAQHVAVNFSQRPLGFCAAEADLANYQVCRERTADNRCPKFLSLSTPRKSAHNHARMPHNGRKLPGEYLGITATVLMHPAHFLRQRVLVSQKHSESPFAFTPPTEEPFSFARHVSSTCNVESPGSRLPDRTGIALARNWAGR